MFPGTLSSRSTSAISKPASPESSPSDAASPLLNVAILLVQPLPDEDDLVPDEASLLRQIGEVATETAHLGLAVWPQPQSDGCLTALVFVSNARRDAVTSLTFSVSVERSTAVGSVPSSCVFGSNSSVKAGDACDPAAPASTPIVARSDPKDPTKGVVDFLP